MIGISSYGGYIPRYRLSRMLIVQNMAWYFPVIMAVAGGRPWPTGRDAVSMAVAAARCMKGKDRKALDGSISPPPRPFADRINAGIVAAAPICRAALNADFRP